MHSFLVYTPPNLPETPDTLHIHPDTSIGIDNIRAISAFLSRKPLASSHNTVIIHNAHLLTLPAQNALLKTLEEPPGASLIYLVTSLPNLLLPTILSRVQIISSPDLPATPDLSYTSTLLTQLLGAKVGDRLQILADQDFDRPAALKFLSDLEHLLHTQIHSGLPPTINYQLLTDTRRYLTANCNLKLCLTHLAAHL